MKFTLFPTRSKRLSNPLCWARPRIEILEDRTVPSGLPIASRSIVPDALARVITTTIQTTTTLSSTPPTSVPGQSYQLTATVAATDATALPASTVTFSDQTTGLTLGTANLDASQDASFTVTSAVNSGSSTTAGAHLIEAAYNGAVSGPSEFAGSLAYFEQEVTDPTRVSPTVSLGSSSNPAMPGAAINLTAVVLAPVGNAPAPTGQVDFLDGNAFLGQSLLSTSGGAATAALTVSGLVSGPHLIKAVYAGDSTYNSAAATLNQVLQANTTTTLSASPDPSAPGQAVTLTAVVNGVGTATPIGNVTFADGSIVLATAPLVVVNGVNEATLTTSAFSLGSHTISASFGGDSLFVGSSANITQRVLIPTTTTVVASHNPSGLNHPVTVTAIVSGGFASPPPGLVTFSENGVTLGTGTLAVGNGMNEATFTTSALGQGSHTITASYAGAEAFAVSVGTTTVEVQSTAIVAIGAGAGGGPEVRVFDAPTNAVKMDFFPYDAHFHGGVRVAVGDVNGDGIPDIITGPGPGGGPEIKVFDGATGAVLRDFMAFSPNFQDGVFVAAGDVEGSGRADIIVGADAGGGPEVAVFSGADGHLVNAFFAYDPNFHGGVRVAAGDVTGSGRAEIITAPGAGGGPDIRVFDGLNPGLVLRSFFAYDPHFGGGVYVSAADVNGDGTAEIIAGAGPGGGPQISIFSGADDTVLTSFFAYDPGFRGGVRVGAVDINANGNPQLLTGAGPGGGPEFQALDAATLAPVDSFFAYDPTFQGGIFVAGGQ
jgi:hypothetical protein